MKRVLGLVMMVMVIMACSIQVEAAGLGEYSKGWRMGQLTKFSIKGMMLKSGEGQMLMGSESTPYYIKDGDGNKKHINPWYFSSSKGQKRIHQQIRNNIGEYVVMEYSEAQFKSPKVNTRYEILDISQIGEPVKQTCNASAFNEGNKSEGVRVGRIVKASIKGNFHKTYELIIQQGNSGNQFKNMTITDDPALFDCAVNFLKAGQKVKVHYSEAFFKGFNDSSYSIYKLEPVSGLN